MSHILLIKNYKSHNSKSWQRCIERRTTCTTDTSIHCTTICRASISELMWANNQVFHKKISCTCADATITDCASKKKEGA